MSLAIEIKFEGMEEVLKKINDSADMKAFDGITEKTALKANKMIKEATPKGKPGGHYLKDGTFVLKGEGIKQGGTARKGWQMWRSEDAYNLGNAVSYTGYILYAWKRVSDVVDDTFMAPKRKLKKAINLMEGTLNDFYQAEIKKRFAHIWG